MSVYEHLSLQELAQELADIQMAIETAGSFNRATLKRQLFDAECDLAERFVKLEQFMRTAPVDIQSVYFGKPLED